MYSNEYDFEKAFRFLLKWEGGYVNDPDDPGGETKFGLSKRAFPDLDIKNLTEDDAKEIYFKHYWIPLKCHKLDWPLNIVLFDTGVNLGIKRASKLLQEAINSFGYRLVVDGIIGPKTLKYAKMIDPSKLALRLIRERVKYYSHLNHLDKFKNGWINRCFDLIESVMMEE